MNRDIERERKEQAVLAKLSIADREVMLLMAHDAWHEGFHKGATDVQKLAIRAIEKLFEKP